MVVIIDIRFWSCSKQSKYFEERLKIIISLKHIFRDFKNFGAFRNISEPEENIIKILVDNEIYEIQDLL